MPAPQVDAIQSDLVSTTPATVETVLAAPVRAAYANAPFVLLPPGSSLVIDPSTMVVTGNTATVTAKVTGQQPGTWLLLLDNEDGKWLVYGTRDAS